ncbi:chromosomal replication initiator protein DnaA [Parvibaculum sp.]|uniref:chromosomal replication initiator protein DnaA n=1 Tax=Parvibaculum sp. TaxID=2024848 RepID=UPI002CBBE202|nr:chromosomal replication initiator protein DnaA [Parvibaculum sp.]HUD51891.1 chromosomal replication initiator protein DnaA [Parvibaculum sp.]
METSLSEQWRRVRARLHAELGEATFNSWFKQIELIGVGDGRVMLAVPTRFIRNWLLSHYAERLSTLWGEEDAALSRIEVLVRTRGEPASPRDGVAQTGHRHDVPARAADAASADRNVAPRIAKPSAPILPMNSVPMQVPSGFEDAGVGAPLDPRFTFDAFVVGKSNELAHAAARRVAEATDVTFNPLFLYGGVGLGKTHLMHAIAWEIRRRQPERKVLYLSAEKFMYQFVRALRFKDTMAFKQQFRTVDVLMIDDVQFISGKDSTQEEFFHTFNALIDHNRQVIISADRSPSDLEGIEERIRSRLGWGLAADIHPTDYELRLGILQAKAEEMASRNGPVTIPDGVLEFLAHRIVSNVRELEGALKRVVAYASLVGRPITLDMSQDVLRDLLRCNDRKITIEEIQRRVAEYYNVRLADMLSARRARAVARPRQVAMYLSKQLTTRSLPEIGRKFGGRDHTTVIHAVRKIDELRQADSGMDEDVDLLRRMLEGGNGAS